MLSLCLFSVQPIDRPFRGVSNEHDISVISVLPLHPNLEVIIVRAGAPLNRYFISFFRQQSLATEGKTFCYLSGPTYRIAVCLFFSYFTTNSKLYKRFLLASVPPLRLMLAPPLEQNWVGPPRPRRWPFPTVSHYQLVTPRRVRAQAPCRLMLLPCPPQCLPW